MNAATPSAPSSERRQRTKPSASRRSPSSSGRSRVVRASSRSTATACGDCAAIWPATASAAVLELGDGHDLLDEPPGVGRLGVDELAGQVEEHRAARADEARQPLCAAAARDQPELDLGLAERRVVGADADVAAHRELEPAAEAEAADRGDERRPRRVHPVAELLDPARRAALGVPPPTPLAQRRELLDVRAGDERPLARAAQHDRADAVVGVERVDLRLELLEERASRARSSAGCRS